MLTFKPEAKIYSIIKGKINNEDIWYLEGESFLALRLPTDHNDTQDAQKDQNDTRHHPHDLQIHDGFQTQSQNHAQRSDQRSYTDKRILELVHVQQIQDEPNHCQLYHN